MNGVCWVHKRELAKNGHCLECGGLPPARPSLAKENRFWFDCSKPTVAEMLGVSPERILVIAGRVKGFFPVPPRPVITVDEIMAKVDAEFEGAELVCAVCAYNSFLSVMAYEAKFNRMTTRRL